MLIAIEGVDGAGKRTLTAALRAAWRDSGQTVAELTFPRYGTSLPADLAAEALHGRHGDLLDSVYAMATLFALDRAGARDDLVRLLDANDVVICDRYVASNAAYSAARLNQDADGPVTDWIAELEYERIGLPRPHRQVLLDVPVALAGQRARRRAGADTARARDSYERDEGLQARTSSVYRRLAQAGFGGGWEVVGPEVEATGLALRLLA